MTIFPPSLKDVFFSISFHENMENKIFYLVPNLNLLKRIKNHKVNFKMENPKIFCEKETLAIIYKITLRYLGKTFFQLHFSLQYILWMWYNAEGYIASKKSSMTLKWFALYRILMICICNCRAFNLWQLLRRKYIHIHKISIKDTRKCHIHLDFFCIKPYTYDY